MTDAASSETEEEAARVAELCQARDQQEDTTRAAQRADQERALALFRHLDALNQELKTLAPETAANQRAEQERARLEAENKALKAKVRKSA